MGCGQTVIGVHRTVDDAMRENCRTMHDDKVEADLSSPTRARLDRERSLVRLARRRALGDNSPQPGGAAISG